MNSSGRQFDDADGKRFDKWLMVEALSSVEAEDVVLTQSFVINNNVHIRRQKGIYSKYCKIAKMRKQKLEIDVAAKEREMSIEGKELELKEIKIELKKRKIYHKLEIEIN